MLRRLRSHVRSGSAAVALAVTVGAEADAALPTEFRLFKAGWNKTENGDYLFDEEAFEATKAAYEAWGVDRMIDLEHLSLDADSPNYDPDAYGWCSLDFRDDGELWAVGVTWTEDGESRLRTKKQRFISPAFAYDTKSLRVTAIVNIAITALPATHGTAALVAASARAARVSARDLRKLSAGASFSNVMCALNKALQEKFAAGPEWKYAWVVDVFDTTVVFDVDGLLYEVAYTFDGAKATLTAEPIEVVRSYTAAAPPAAAEPAPAAAANKAKTIAKPAKASATASKPKAAAAVGKNSMDDKLIRPALDALKNDDGKKAIEILEGLLVTAAGGTEEAPPADDPPKPKPEAEKAPGDEKTGENKAEGGEGGDDKKDEPMVAAARVALALTGETDPGKAMAELGRRSKLALEIEQREASHKKDVEVLEAGERRQLVGELVKLGVEIPATAWSDDKGTVPCDRLKAEPIAELRARVAMLSKPGVRSTNKITPPALGAGGEHDLSPRELAICAEKKLDPAAFAKHRADMRARSTSTSNRQGA